MTSQEINELPERARSYIHDLETRADPAGEVRALAACRDNLDALQVRNAELSHASTDMLKALEAAHAFFVYRGWPRVEPGPDMLVHHQISQLMANAIDGAKGVEVPDVEIP